MKKIMLTAALIAAASFLTSCNADGFDVSSEIDTNLQLDTPSVKVSAWPGMNYVSWKPVSNANGYVVFIYEDGHHINTVPLSYDVLNYKHSTDLKNGATYEYFVEAESKTSTGRSVVTQNSKCGSDSCTAIVPDYNVKSLELNNHEKGINKAGKKDYIIASDNIHLAVDNYETFSFSFPSKAYLQYVPYLVIDNEQETVGDLNTVDGNALAYSSSIDFWSDNATNDKIMVGGKRPIKKSGTYKLGVVAVSENEHFGVSEPVVSTESVEIKRLSGTVGDITSAAYCDANKVRVVFPKFTLEGGNTAPESYYKVYRSVKDAASNYTPVTGTVKFTNSAKTALYVEDTVTDNTKTLIYTVVVTDGTRFAGNFVTKSVDPFALGDQAKTIVSGTPTTEENDATANDITWTITKAATDVEITGIKILEVPATDADSHTVVAADFTKEIALSELNWTTNVDSKTYTVYTKNHTVGTKVYMLVTTSQFNKKDAEWISTSGVEIKAPAVSKDKLKINAYKYDNRLDFSNTTIEKVFDDIVVAVSDTYTVASDSNANYTYELWMAESTVTKDISAGTITYKYGENWAKVKDITLSELNAYDTTKTDAEYTVDYKMDNCPNGVYSFRVIKKSKTTGEFVSSGIATVTIDTSSSIAFTPNITANWYNTSDTSTGTIKIEYRKDNTSNDSEYDSQHDTGHSYPINIISETDEDIHYTLYRAKLYNKAGTQQIDPYEVVFTEVAKITNTTVKEYPYTKYYYDKDSDSMKPATGSYNWVDYIDYSYTDGIKTEDKLSTGVTYQYVVVASKDGCKDVISNIVEVTGSN